MIPEFTILAAPLLKLKRIRIVTWYAHPTANRRLKLAHHLSDRMVTSVATAYPYKRDKLVVVGQGIDTDLFSPDKDVSPDEPLMILCVGRISPVKDHPTLLKAAWLLRQRSPKPFQVIIVGKPASPRDEAYVRALHAQVKELELEDIVRFEPAVPMVNLPSWYRRCTVHVNLTPTGFGDKVAWEAMACGKPCLVANEGFRETLWRWAERLLFQHGDAEDLAEKLWALLQEHPEQLATIGQDLRQSVIKHHSLQRLAERFVEVFHDVMSSS
jgi:glycosyltransferase involved in cell wall biosynthesis